MNKTETDRYFDLLRATLDKLEVQPEHIWNCDETNIQLEHKPKAVVGRKGSNVPGRVANSKESVSILGCGNAVGTIMSPMVIVKGKTKRSLMGWKTEDAPPNTKWTFQSKSYMDTCLGLEWFQNVFLQECGSHRPQLLILDSHCSHETLDLLELGKKENITLLSLPSHCTHYLQPWDRSMFSPLKNNYNTVCTEFMAENVGHNVTKQTWPGLFCKAWVSAITSTNMKSGFSSTGIYPFNVDAIPKEAFITASQPLGNITQSSTTMVEENLMGETSQEVSSAETPVGLVDNSEIIYSQGETHTVVAEINLCVPQSSTTLDLPVYVEGDVQTVSLPVIFEDLQTDEVPNLGDLALKEVSTEELPSELWNSELDTLVSSSRKYYFPSNQKEQCKCLKDIDII